MFFSGNKSKKQMSFLKVKLYEYKPENKKHQIHLEIYHSFVHLFIYSTNKPGTVLSNEDPIGSKKKSHHLSGDLHSLGDR